MNILIVDDDNTNILILSSILKHEGYTVVTASNGYEAVDRFSAGSIDLVLMDVMMPVMDGYQATVKIKDLSIDRFVPVIFLTAVTDEHQLAKCVESGGDDFLTKPYNRVILRSKIEAMTRIQMLYDVVSEQKSALIRLNEKVEDDLDLAKHVYDSILATTKVDPIFDTFIVPVADFNGDVVLSVKNSYGGYHFMLGDFTGHGLAASFGTIPVADLFYRMSDTGYKIADIAVEINNRLNTLLPTGYFCAACFVSIDEHGNTVNILNAGVPEILLIQDGIITTFPSVHLPLGVIKTNLSKLKFVEYNITAPSRLIVYSDGVIEAKNSLGEMYGLDTFKRMLEYDSGKDLNGIVNEIETFRGSNVQDDDITLASIQLPLSNITLSNMDDNIKPDSYGWSLSLSFKANAIRTQQPAMKIIGAIMSQNIPDSYKDKIFTIITELYNNSLEHGILGLESSLKSSPDGFSEYYTLRETLLSNLSAASIQVTITNIPNDKGGVIRFEQKDSGKGFDYTDILNSGSNNTYSGRGIMLVRSLCTSVEYSENGTKVCAEFEWHYEQS
ncbi:MAG: fused response regulator/phosphatase [Gammaproteobacteria bacterium]|nr:fused response regulator/phosphatase [Gammaproteobacteria bacterium]